MSDLTRDQITHLAQLAHVNLTEEELNRMSQEVSKILDSVAKVQEVDTEHVMPTSHPIALTNVYRDDVVGPVLSQQEALSGAPDAEAGRFKVPAILHAEDDR
ncbi:Asp-tRNA(Asn)/Glu-tRNA(Gln) amidotransferase subunit GatC [Enteractinococcus helveticum]|uniref:Aspartyl/glutamyl-tRNA(Asn/Gln) amidotransferase subunit C n=1 Tax=Enteractinococcus helveticum TaxID=1837282 RepID=A0A1B7M119_9MICC|nr:Asp-tRNA(Asn)/Glu-tRNA(Gln) amidotransferase subunit GatC [Enteractinococcus helveticum]OAV62121.1 asparaginyl/glutamyl-tRNA amidotransferase subunit C [Enteractinococcus helveticum]